MSGPFRCDAAIGAAIGITFGTVMGVAAYREIGWIGIACIVIGAWMAAIVALLYER